MSFKPLCPAMPPPCFRRTVPAGKSSSSCTTSTSSGLILKKPASICTGCPLRFMNDCGRSSHEPLPVLPTSALNLGSLRRTTPFAWANFSTSQKPALWRVRSYSLPGFPRPTTSLITWRLPLLLVFLLALLSRLLGGLRGRLLASLGRTLGRRFALLRLGGLLGRRNLRRRDRGGGSGGFLFLGDELRHDHRGDDGVLVLLEGKLDAFRQLQVARVDRVPHRQVAEVDLDEFRQVVRE